MFDSQHARGCSLSVAAALGIYLEPIFDCYTCDIPDDDGLRGMNVKKENETPCRGSFQVA